MDGAPAGSISACYPSGWIQTDIFINGSIILFTSKAFDRWSCLADCWRLLFTHQKFRCGG